MSNKISFSCISPYIVRDKKSNRSIPVPCNKCAVCIKRRISGWVFRLQQEEKKSESAYFVTLTYNDKFLKGSPDGLMTLCKKDLQDYFKRLRKLSSRKIKYFAVGEYGTEGDRPHYHLILFNASPENIIKAWSLDGHGLGHVHFGDVTGASITYSLGYLHKRHLARYEGDDREPEFGLMSKSLAAPISQRESDHGIKQTSTDHSLLWLVDRGSLYLDITEKSSIPKSSGV